MKGTKVSDDWTTEMESWLRQRLEADKAKKPTWQCVVCGGVFDDCHCAELRSLIERNPQQGKLNGKDYIKSKRTYGRARNNRN